MRAGIRAVAPGRDTTLYPASIAIFDKAYPGSLIIGVPLSLASPTFFPSFKNCINFSLFCLSLCS